MEALEGIFTEPRNLARDFTGYFLVFLGLFVLLSLVTHSQVDPSLNHVLSDDTPVQNYAGKLGAYISGSLSDLFGIAAYIWPLVFSAVGVACVVPAYELLWWRWLGYFLLTICLLFIGAAWDIQLGEIYGGGMVGDSLYANASSLLSHWGSVILWFFLFSMATQLTFGISWLNVCRKIKFLCQTRISTVKMTALPEFKMPALPSPKDIMGKVTAKSKHKPLPEVYDVESRSPDDTEESDDPNIRIVPRKKVKKKPKAEKSQSAAAPIIVNDAYSEQDEQYEYEDYDDAQNTYGNDESPYKEEQSAQTQEDAHLAERKGLRALFSFGKNEASAPENDEQEGSSKQKRAHKQADTHHNEYDDEYDDEYNDEYDHSQDSDDTYEEEYTEAPAQANNNQVTSKANSQGGPQVVPPKPAAPPSGLAPHAAVKNTGIRRKFTFPSLELLQSAAPSSPTARSEMEQKGEALVSCLSDFGIQGELVRITPGPVVTMYEFRPAAGIRVNRIANLTDDIALALKAIAIRIQAPIPGSDTVGIEIPNVQRDIVNFREILESKAFKDAGGPLNMVLGKNIAGKPFVAELSKMPHLLVAGATGAGKSVGLNAILMSLLYTTQPEDMQLLLIDPKRIEMAVYADLPHLVHPVVTEMQFAKTALEWAVAEMDKRYEAMARLGVRNITGYNQKLKDLGNNRPAELAELEPLPYLVIIIDELADLMLTAAREVETSIVRLAQLARAAGIHMILATQRPSVDVVTGIIKANFPCRISFQVTSKHDSRTILDMVGAEHLLGKGDMLFKPSGGRLMRLHGPFVPDEEVVAVVSHWKRQSPPQYKVDFASWGTEQNEISGGGLGDASDDSLYPQVRAFVEEQGKASISLVQRRFRIGFNRAAVLMEQLERDGIIGPADGSKPRSVIR